SSDRGHPEYLPGKPPRKSSWQSESRQRHGNPMQYFPPYSLLGHAWFFRIKPERHQVWPCLGTERVDHPSVAGKFPHVLERSARTITRKQAFPVRAEIDGFAPVVARNILGLSGVHIANGVQPVLGKIPGEASLSNGDQPLKVEPLRVKAHLGFAPGLAVPSEPVHARFDRIRFVAGVFHFEPL